MEKVFFEPTGRLIMSIGRDLIKDSSAALVELVKNSYDADATEVNIKYIRENDKLTILVKDNGHGMSPDIVINTWMAPATGYKLNKMKSPNGRIYQGRKGIGRYAVSLLGNKLKLITVNNGMKTTALFDWNEFENALKLSDVPVEIEVEKTEEENFTELIIINEELTFTDSSRESISENDALKIEKEFSKMLYEQKGFNIYVSYDNFFRESHLNRRHQIKQYASDLAFHYRLKGNVYENYDYEFHYINSYSNTEKEFKGNFKEKLINFETLPSCGEIAFDYKVYDKDSEGIEVITDFLNGRGNVKPLSNRETKKLLVDNSGISIYRNGFRIRPYGDKGFDWLNLDSKRVQNPSMDIGFDQINGRIEITSEEISGLKEKSARDGLYENENYFVLQKIADLVLDILEKERFLYRKKKPVQSKQKVVDKLFDFSTTSSNIEKQIKNTFDKIEISPEKSKEYFQALQEIVGKEIESLEKEKHDSFEEIKQEVAIYQKHATLGNVINVVLHEGRKPLTWFSHTIPKIIRRFKKQSFDNSQTSQIFSDSIEELEKLKNEADRLSRLFRRLDPLSSTRRKKAKLIDIKNEIQSVIDIFSEYAKQQHVSIFLSCPEGIKLTFVEEDLYMALTNILENSIFWVGFSKSKNKQISVLASKSEEGIIIDILDNGPGVAEEDILNGIIFIPGYSAKKNVSDQNGTGLGLAIAGEALSRNSGTLEAIKSENGAHFRIKILEEVLNDETI